MAPRPGTWTTNPTVGIREDTSETVITFVGDGNSAESMRRSADFLLAGEGGADNRKRRKRQEKPPQPSPSFKAAMRRLNSAI